MVCTNLLTVKITKATELWYSEQNGIRWAGEMAQSVTHLPTSMKTLVHSPTSKSGMVVGAYNPR